MNAEQIQKTENTTPERIGQANRPDIILNILENGEGRTMSGIKYLALRILLENPGAKKRTAILELLRDLTQTRNVGSSGQERPLWEAVHIVCIVTAALVSMEEPEATKFLDELVTIETRQRNKELKILIMMGLLHFLQPSLCPLALVEYCKGAIVKILASAGDVTGVDLATFWSREHRDGVARRISERFAEMLKQPWSALHLFDIIARLQPQLPATVNNFKSEAQDLDKPLIVIIVHELFHKSHLALTTGQQLQFINYARTLLQPAAKGAAQ